MTKNDVRKLINKRVMVIMPGFKTNGILKGSTDTAITVGEAIISLDTIILIQPLDVKEEENV